MTTDKRLVNLDVNDSGGWRRVTSFDIDTFEDGELEHAAEKLLEMTSNQRLKARIIPAGDPLAVPLLTWTRDDGWREWVHPCDREVA